MIVGVSPPTFYRYLPYGTAIDRRPLRSLCFACVRLSEARAASDQLGVSLAPLAAAYLLAGAALVGLHESEMPDNVGKVFCTECWNRRLVSRPVRRSIFIE